MSELDKAIAEFNLLTGCGCSSQPSAECPGAVVLTGNFMFSPLTIDTEERAVLAVQKWTAEAQARQ